MMRVGHGYDVHRLRAGQGVVIGGVHIPCEFELVAHSDGDVAIHALCDALLGAAGLGDIGQHFPDSDSQWKNVDSREFLRSVRGKLAGEGWQVGNADVTVVAQKPKLAGHIATMRASLAEDLQITVSQINVKATTTEELGPIGRCEGIAAHAVACLVLAD